MADFQSIADNELDPGSPLTTSLMGRIVRNPEAIAEGDPGAPPVEIGALGRAIAGDVERYYDGSTNNTTGLTYINLFRVVLGGQGVVRVKLQHQSNDIVWQSRVRIQVNGVTVASWTRAAGYVSRSYDLTYAPGDEIKIQHSASEASTVSAVRNIELATDGELLIPIMVDDPKWSFS